MGPPAHHRNSSSRSGDPRLAQAEFLVRGLPSGANSRVKPGSRSHPVRKGPIGI